MVNKIHCYLTLIFTVGAVGFGCGSKPSVPAESVVRYSQQTMTSQLTLDVRVFDMILKGDTNLALEVLARHIDTGIVQLHHSNQELPLDQSTRALFRSAAEYRRTSVELNRLGTNSQWEVSVTAILEELK
jgi:hypothetical protein